MNEYERFSDELRRLAAKAENLGFDAYCTECDSATYLTEGRCGCGSGRVVTTESLSPNPNQIPNINERGRE